MRETGSDANTGDFFLSDALLLGLVYISQVRGGKSAASGGAGKGKMGRWLRYQGHEVMVDIHRPEYKSGLDPIRARANNLVFSPIPCCED